jgi:hypothetical protein
MWSNAIWTAADGEVITTKSMDEHIRAAHRGEVK